ncbi:hypothetical protein AX14_013322 [Amanita brunnescens Koide BX004]|nr:hypothetical protein AX14_013322 [Amanita brunnescens Koide BX004]
MSRSDAHVFQLEGNYDTFRYEYSYVNRFWDSSCGGVRIGEIRPDATPWLKEKLQEVRVVRNDPDFDCQTWVLEAIQLLKDVGGIIYSGITERGVRQELYEEKERWEAADDTIIERLYPSIAS